MTYAKRIMVVTGTRADYGLLRWIMTEIQQDSDLELILVATMMHLSPVFGNTYREIESHGFTISHKLDILADGDNESAAAQTLANGVAKFSDLYQADRPDLLLLLGDRPEMLAASNAALFHKIPIAHIHGGESTVGAADEAIRHSLTKMAHLHFTSTDVYRKRVIQLGEEPARVFNVGAPGLEILTKLKLLTKLELEADLNFAFGQPTMMITYHPVTLETRPETKAFAELLTALENFPTASLIFSFPNSDPSGQKLIEQLKEFKRSYSGNILITPSLGQLRYLSVVANSDVVVGNSSSGVVEVPFLKTPTVNIGRRQQGRLTPSSVINCNETTKDIKAAITASLTDKFQQIAKSSDNIYGNGHVANKLIEIIKSQDLSGILFKKFHDILP